MPTKEKILLIGYGNELRGDDAAGPQIARTVEGWSFPDCEVIVCQQLTPELAHDIAEASQVIFVDASLEVMGDTPQTLPVHPAPEMPLGGHTLHPETLVRLAKALYGKAPPAVCVHVPASSFELGAPLSPATQKALTSALVQIKTLCQTPI